MYKLLGMDAPMVKIKQIVSAPPLVIDRTGESDPAVYRGLRLGQMLDDELQGQALQEVQQKIARGERPAVSQVLEQVESFEVPFADKRNTGPKQTPDWTVEKLDEWGRRQGRVEAWARKAKEGVFVNDPNVLFHKTKDMHMTSKGTSSGIPYFSHGLLSFLLLKQIRRSKVVYIDGEQIHIEIGVFKRI